MALEAAAKAQVGAILRLWYEAQTVAEAGVPAMRSMQGTPEGIGLEASGTNVGKGRGAV